MVAFLLFLFFYSLLEAQANQLNISIGSSLSPGSNNSSWLSPSGRYAFGFYNESNGFAVGIFVPGIPKNTVVWIANWDPEKFVQQERIVSSNATLMLTTDRGVILQANGKEINITNLYGSQRVVYNCGLQLCRNKYPIGSVASASMLDNGNFVLYKIDGNITWQSFDNPTDTLLPGQQLSASQQLFSRASETDFSRGLFRVEMQKDGNLVQYPAYTFNTGEYSYYSTGTNQYGIEVTLNLEEDGHLYLLSFTEIIKNITKGRGGIRQGILYMMRLDVDGILRLYSVSLDKGNWSTVWNSTDNKCNPKGRCGVNGYCVLTDQDISCNCAPGFDFINKENQRLGCEKKFTAISCSDLNRSVTYAMQKLDYTVWENSPYDVPESINVEDCEQKCMEDCNCEVALFKDKRCRKQRLPLRFGRKDVKDPDVVLIKVGSKLSIGNEYREIIIKKEDQTNILILGISLIVLGILVWATTGVFLNRYHQWLLKKINLIENLEITNDVTLQAFSYGQLVQITNNFNEQVGKGASATVYKGILSNSQTAVAVKKLETELAEGEREFETEMKVIAKTHHRNLVNLLGYCIDGTNRLLVYEFMGNGSLANILFAPKDRLSWMERVRIATDIVKGILYLHEECNTQIIHCDIKPQNILMDENMCAKISDFGLAKLLKQDQSRTTTGVRGTKGYVAPEWFRKLPVTVKADVYSFGVVLLEIICHRRNVNWSLPENETILDEWVYSCFMTGELSKLTPDEQVDMKQLERWVKVGIWCIQEEPSLRPSMNEVLLMLEGTIDAPIPPTPSSF